MSKTARTPTTPASRPRVRTIAQAAERATHATPAPVRDETRAPAHASEETASMPAGAVEDATPSEPDEPRPIRGGLLHSKRDVDEAMGQVRQAVAAFAQRGIMVTVDQLDLTTLRPRAQALALCRLLVRKGILAQEEIQYEEAAALLEMLSKIYQRAEEQTLAARRPVVATRGDIILPGRQ